MDFRHSVTVWFPNNSDFRHFLYLVFHLVQLMSKIWMSEFPINQKSQLLLVLFSDICVWKLNKSVPITEITKKCLKTEHTTVWTSVLLFKDWNDIKYVFRNVQNCFVLKTHFKSFIYFPQSNFLILGLGLFSNDVTQVRGSYFIDTLKAWLKQAI